ncbi:MAG: hypothetical protein V1888_04260 [archaeon]
MKDLEEATDMELAIDIANHINYPCYFPKGTDEYLALRKSYIAMAKEMVIPVSFNFIF